MLRGGKTNELFIVCDDKYQTANDALDGDEDFGILAVDPLMLNIESREAEQNLGELYDVKHG